MMGTPRRLLLGLVIAATVATAACGQPATNPQTVPETPPGAGAFGGPGPATTPSPATGQSPAASPQVNYPRNAMPYAEAVLTAWRAGQRERLAALTTPEVYEQILEIPGQPDQTWSPDWCEGAAGSSYCLLFNRDGNAIVLRVTNQLLGKAHGVSEVRFPYFAASEMDYVREFVEAWRMGHRQRMLMLATPEVVDAVAGKPAPQNPDYDKFEVDPSKIGAAHAITGYVP